jgi:hypothetical protein
MKGCSRCGVEKPLTEFYADKGSPDGRRSYCKPCHLAQMKSSRTAEKRREDSRRRRERDPEAVREHSRAWAQANPERRRERNQRFRAQHPEKDRAHNLVGKAVARGTLTKPDACEDCGRDGRIEAHHDDYARPLEVRWLCKPCHHVADRARV